MTPMLLLLLLCLDLLVLKKRDPIIRHFVNDELPAGRLLRVNGTVLDAFNMFQHIETEVEDVLAFF